MFWMIVTRFFCKTEILRDFPCTLKAGIFSLIESIVSSPFVKAEADSVEYFVLCLKRYVRLH
jgi:hypothetical protein